MGKDAPKLVVLDPADEGGAQTESRHPHHGIGGRAAGHLHRRTHRIVDARRPRFIDQLHGSFAHIVSDEEILVGARDHIDNGVADAEDVGGDDGHERLGVVRVDLTARAI